MNSRFRSFCSALVLGLVSASSLQAVVPSAERRVPAQASEQAAQAPVALAQFNPCPNGNCIK